MHCHSSYFASIGSINVWMYCHNRCFASINAWMHCHNSYLTSIGSINVWMIHGHRATRLLKMAELVEKLPAGFLQVSDDVNLRLVALPEEHTRRADTVRAVIAGTTEHGNLQVLVSRSWLLSIPHTVYVSHPSPEAHEFSRRVLHLICHRSIYALLCERKMLHYVFRDLTARRFHQRQRLQSHHIHRVAVGRLRHRTRDAHRFPITILMLHIPASSYKEISSQGWAAHPFASSCHLTARHPRPDRAFIPKRFW